MEHRNSTVMTEAASIATGRRGLLDTVAHEFFHGWNVGAHPPALDRAVRFRTREHVE